MSNEVAPCAIMESVEAPESRQSIDEGSNPLNLTLLSAEERTLLTRLCVFRAGSTLATIEELLRTSWDYLEDPFDVLHKLVEESLIVVEEPPRYRVLEEDRGSIAATMSAEERETAMTGLFTWADHFCARIGEGRSGDEEESLDRINAELDNIRDAIEFGNARPDLRLRSLRMAVDLRHFWVVRGHYALGRTLIEPTLDGGGEIPGDLRADATNLLGVLAMSMGDLQTAERRLSESLVLARQASDTVAQGRVLGNLGMIAWERMDFSSAQDAFREAAAIFRGNGAWRNLGTALLNLGCVFIDMDRPDEAKSALESSLDPFRRSEDHTGLAYAMGNLGYLALIRDNREEALRSVRASLEAFVKLGDWKGTMNTLISAATLLAATDLGSAATIRGAIEAMSLREGTTSTPRDEQRLVEIDRTLDAAPDAASIRKQWTKGLAMSPQNGIEYALSALSAVMPPEGS